MEKTSAPDRPVVWHVRTGARVTVSAPRDSYADRRAPREVRTADRLVAALDALLTPADSAVRDVVAISLIDPVPGHAAAVHSSAAVVHVVSPDTPPGFLGGPIAEALVVRSLGPAAAEPWLIAGLAGVAAAQAKVGPSRAEIDDAVRADLAAGRPVAGVFRRTRPVDRSADGVDLDETAASFVHFLLDRAGPRGLRTFLVGYDSDRRDAAAVTAFGQPLGALEETWIATLRRRRAGGAAFRSFLRQVGPLLRPYWRSELEVLASMLLALSYTLAMPFATRYLVDDLIPRRRVHALLVFVLALLVVYVVDALVLTRRSYLTNRINQQVLQRLQERLFGKLQQLPHDFYNRAKIGDLLSRLSGDLEVVDRALDQVAGFGALQALSALSAAVAMLVLDPLLGVVVVAVLPLFAVSYLVLGERLERASRALLERTGEAASVAQEALAAHAMVKAFGLEQRMAASYRDRLAARRGAFLREVVIGVLFDVSSALATVAGRLVVLGLGGYLAIEGRLTVGTLLAFVNLVPALFVPVAALSDVGQTVQKAAGALDRVGEVLDEPETVADAPGATALPPLAGEIRFAAISFGYGDHPVLSGLELSIPAGSHVAIVGPSGAGKSTIANLLLRFWDPDEGRLLFDGHDVREATLASLRGQIGVVFQETFIFDTTLRENVAIGRSGASDAEVAAAVRAARLDTYVASLPAGYDTVLGERGVRMSGGQRQRLAIARAILRDPRLLILDEATSALDAQTEREILDTLAAVARGRTMISITHRLSLAAAADRIAVLDGGRIVEEGAHRDLIGAGGLYQRLAQQQDRLRESDEPPASALATRLRAAGLTEAEIPAILGAVRTDGSAAAPDRAARVRAIPLFAGLDDAAAAVLAERLQVERYDADRDVVRQGEDGDRLYVIDAGKVDVVMGKDERTRTVGALGPGDYFGEMALLGGGPRAATVRTTAPSAFFVLRRDDFMALLKQSAAIRRAVEETVAARRTALTDAVAGGAPSPAVRPPDPESPQSS